MITILPADKAFLESISAPEGTDAMVLRDSTHRVTGHALFALAGDTIEVLSVTAEEPLLVEGLIRAVLNTGDCRGARFGLCRQPAMESVLRRLEFEPGEDGWTVSIAAFLRGECHCS